MTAGLVARAVTLGQLRAATRHLSDDTELMVVDTFGPVPLVQGGERIDESRSEFIFTKDEDYPTPMFPDGRLSDNELDFAGATVTIPVTLVPAPE